jgi:glycosyltransferase involved in cell wall biosynthesis
MLAQLRESISHYTAKRIKKAYGRESTVIYPPVDIAKFEVYKEKEDFYVTASRMVPYKRLDLLVEAFARMPEKKLIVFGDGLEMKKVKAQAALCKNIQILGFQPFEVLKEYLQRAKAFLFAAEEEFGIAPVEAQACGTPVIAFGRGGVKETVIDGKTGILFEEQTAESLMRAVKQFEKKEDTFDPAVIRKSVERFNTERFKREFKQFVDEKVEVFFG